jgi:5-methyltetrahydropteroyltriglutamate--homocysteine methyltransferase
MQHSTDRILTTHAGSLPRPPELREMVVAKAAGTPYDQVAFDGSLSAAVSDVIRRLF